MAGLASASYSCAKPKVLRDCVLHSECCCVMLWQTVIWRGVHLRSCRLPGRAARKGRQRRIQLLQWVCCSRAPPLMAWQCSLAPFSQHLSTWGRRCWHSGHVGGSGSVGTARRRRGHAKRLAVWGVVKGLGGLCTHVAVACMLIDLFSTFYRRWATGRRAAYAAQQPFATAAGNELHTCNHCEGRNVSRNALDLPLTVKEGRNVTYHR